MNKIIVALACLLPLLNACTKSCTKSAESKEKVLRVGTNANFPPFETIDDKGKLAGFDIDLGRALGKKLGLRVEFKEFDFDALILALDKGQIDIILSGLSITESRQQEIAMIPYHGEPLTEISVLFWQNTPADIKNFSDLKDMALSKQSTISVQAGHFLEDFLRGEGIPVKALAGPPEQILDIKYGKSLAAAVDSIVGQKLASEHEGIKNLVLPLPKDKWDLGYGIGINKTRTDLIESLKKAVEDIKADGTLKALKDQWFKGGQ
jgi:arginine transport system substrate-binding protein